MNFLLLEAFLMDRSLFDKLYKDPEYNIGGEYKYTKEEYYTRLFTIPHC